MDRFEDIADALANSFADDVTNFLDELKKLTANKKLSRKLNKLQESAEKFIEKYKKMETSLQEAMARYRRLEKNIPGTVFVHVVRPDGSGSFRYMSDRAKELFGLDPKDIIRDQRVLFDLIHSDDIAAVENNIRQTTESLKPCRQVFRHIINGEIRWYEVVAQPELCPNGDVVADGFTIEVTDQKRIEESLREKEERLRVGNEAAQIGTYVTDLESDKVCWSHELCRILGVPPGDERTNEAAFEVVHPEDLNRVLEISRQGLDPGGDGAFSSEHRIIRPDGEIRWLIWRGRTLFRETASGRIPSRRIGACVDITERKQIEDALQASERKFAAIFQASPLGLAITSYRDGRFLEVNPTACLLTGYRREELIGQSLIELGFYHDSEDRQRILKQLDEKGAINNFSMRYRRKSGETRWAMVSASLIEFGGGKCILSTISDVTEYQQTQEALRINEERLRMALEGTSDGIWDWDLPTDHVYFSPRWYTTLGYDPDEFPASYDAWIRLMHPDDVEATEKAVQKAIKELTPFTVEFRLKAKNGKWIWVLSRAKIVEFDQSGAAARLAGSHTDITDRKLVNEALEKRILALTLPLNSNSHIAIEDLFNLADIQHLQDLFAQTCGVGSLITRPDGTPITEPSNSTEVCSEIIRKNPEGLRNCQISDRFMSHCFLTGPKKQPCLSLGLCNAAASITVGGKHIANWLIGQVRTEDMDEEKAAGYARKLGIDEDRFRSAFRKVPLVSQEQFDSAARFLLALANQISNMAYQNVQQARFIADRKRAEETLRKYESIVFASHDAMALINRDYIYEAVNESFLRVHNKKREEVVGVAVPMLMGKKLFQKELKKRLDRALSGETFNYKLTHDYLGVGRRTMNVNYFPMIDRDGKAEGVVLNARDITESQKIEERLMQSQKIESIGTLAGGVAHEINNPINGILNYAQLIIDRSTAGAPAVGLAGEIILEAERISSIVKNLLAFARHEKQPFGPESIKDIVSSVLSLIRTVIRHDNIDLEVDIEKSLPALNCRSQQIQQVLMNLLTNARDALNERYPDRASVKQIRIMVRQVRKRNKKFVRTTVEDNGVGIQPSILVKIFDPFFTTKPKEIGTGLGLSISYGIVKDHGGQLIAESEPGSYTRLHMDLPVSKNLKTS